MEHDHLLEKILLVEEDENRGFLKDRVPRHLCEKFKRLLHSIHGVIFEKHLTSSAAYTQERAGTLVNTHQGSEAEALSVR